MVRRPVGDWRLTPAWGLLLSSAAGALLYAAIFALVWYFDLD